MDVKDLNSGFHAWVPNTLPSSLPSSISFILTAYLLMFQVINGKLVCSFNAQQLVFTIVRKSKFCPQHQPQDYVITRKHPVWRSKVDTKAASNDWSYSQAYTRNCPMFELPGFQNKPSGL